MNFRSSNLLIREASPRDHPTKTDTFADPPPNRRGPFLPPEPPTRFIHRFWGAFFADRKTTKQNMFFQNPPKSTKSGPMLLLYKELYYFQHSFLLTRCPKIRFGGSGEGCFFCSFPIGEKGAQKSMDEIAGRLGGTKRAHGGSARGRQRCPFWLGGPLGWPRVRAVNSIN